MVVAASGQNAFFLHALFKPHFFDALLLALFFCIGYWAFNLVVAGRLDIEPLTLWPGSAPISFSFVSPACMTPSSRNVVVKRDLTIQSVPACYLIKSNGCVLDEEELAPL